MSETYWVTCCNCGEVIPCSTKEEQLEYHHDKRACPDCGSVGDICGGPCCNHPPLRSQQAAPYAPGNTHT